MIAQANCVQIVSRSNAGIPDKIISVPISETAPKDYAIASQCDSSVVKKTQTEICTESGVSKIKRQFESVSQVTSPVLDSDRVSSSCNNASAALAKLKKLEGMNEDGKKTNNVEDKIKKFNEASNLQNSQTLIRSKQHNSGRLKDQQGFRVKEFVTSPPPYEKNIVSDDKPDVASAENKPSLPSTELKPTVTDVAQNPEMYLYHQKSQKKTLDKAKSVDETAVTQVQSKNAPHVSFSSFKSSHSATEILHQVQTREVKQLQAQNNSKAGPSVSKSELCNEIGDNDCTNVKLKSSMRQPIKSATPQVPLKEQVLSQEVLMGADHKSEAVAVELNSSDGKIMFKTCKTKTRDSIPTVPGSSYFTRGSEEIWLVKKKDIEGIEDKVIQSLLIGDTKPAAPVKGQEKIDFLNRPVSTCKSFRRSPVPINSKETKQQKEIQQKPSSTQEKPKDQDFFSHNTETRRSKRFFQFKSESIDHQPKPSEDVAKSQTLKRQTSVSCTCSHDKKIRSKSQGEPIQSPRTAQVPKDTRDLKQKTRSRSQGAADDVQSRQKYLCSQKSSDGVQQKNNQLYRENYSNQSEDDLYEKYETLV